MKSVCVIAALAVLALANAATSGQESSCGKEMELEKQCMLTIETSPEAAMIKERKKQAIKDCLPTTYPQDCHADKEAMHACFLSIAKTAATDPDLKAAQAQSLPAVDECFQKYPPNVGEGLEEIFMPMKPHHRGPPRHKRNHTETDEEKPKNASRSASKEGGPKSGPKSGSKEGGSVEHKMHGPKCGHNKKNNTSGSGSKERGPGWGRDQNKNPQCEKTKEQKQCVKEKLEALGKDANFVGVLDTLIRQKRKCKNLVNWSCTAKTRKQRKCVFKATQPCREAFMGKMKTCMQSKGFTLPPFMMKGENATTPPIIQ